MASVEINPVPGLIRATPATRPSRAWSLWLEKWRVAEPDTRSPYWPIWNRHTAREVLKGAYTERPTKVLRGQARFLQQKAEAEVYKFAKAHKRGSGTSLTREDREDLTSILIVKSLEKGIDITRTHGEVAYFLGKYAQGWLKQGLLYLTQVVHVTAYAMDKKTYRLAARGALPFGGTAPGLNPEGYALLKSEVNGMSEKAFSALVRQAKA